jgi:hypothetical protein
MAATVSDAINFGDNATRGPLYNKSLASLTTGSHVKVLNVNPARKFLLIKPASQHIHVYFQNPGETDAGTPFLATDGNSITVGSGNSDEPLRFDSFVPTNSVWMKSNTAATAVTIYEA